MVDRNFISIAQLTDLHLFAERDRQLVGIPTMASFESVLQQVQQKLLHLDLCLLTGDLSQDCSADSYTYLRQTLDSLAVPTYCVAGNHDDLELMASHLPSSHVHLSRSLNVGNWCMILLSSVISGEVHGSLAESELTFLEETLQVNPDRPTLIAFHHPAISLGSHWIDRLGLENKDRFWAICDRYPQIKAVVNGHAHQDFDSVRITDYGLVRCLITPSTCVQFASHTPQFKIDSQPAGFRHIRLYADGSLETEVHRLEADKFLPELSAQGY
ncbi:MAG: 3',5'-cyclic-AMP phosphodiesterase [Pseudanabaenaceae cyanobacterium bins.39]|nr:3',5'-cyclic-AMP phosphodiesterase [Pseudanabaenaceae cyanobacterium bins.39]